MKGKVDRLTVERADGSEKAMAGVLVSLEEKCLPLEMRNADSLGYFSEALSDQGKIVLLLRFDKKPAGFLLAMRYGESYPELCNDDPNLERSKDDFFYVETILINPRLRSRKEGLRLLVERLKQEMRKRKSRNFCTYARKRNGLSDFIRNNFSGRKLRSIDNWLGFQETFDYLEVRF